MRFEKGSYVFVPDDDECFLAAQVESAFASGDAAQVRLVESGRRLKLASAESAQAQEMDPQSLDPVEDMVHLKHLAEPSILHNLRLRYKGDGIYTNIGSILCAVNPFKVLPIYTPEVVDEYIRKGPRARGPHVFGVADAAFRGLVGFGRSQSCIVSGESGAGKTETTKLFLQYIGERSGSAGSATAGAASAALRERILEANPLMEAFGNAKTVRNDNSSRFGKLITVHLDNKRGVIVGAAISTYLLEKSRVCTQAEGERSFHVLYQVCAAAAMDPQLAQRYALTDADQYWYLNQSSGKASTQLPGVSDANEWGNTEAAMDVLGLDASVRGHVMQLLAGVLHLGNVQFSGNDEKSAVENADALALAARMLGAAPAQLEKALCQRNRGNAKEAVFANQGVEQARDARDALAKAVYSALFDWLMSQINAALASGSSMAGGGDGMTGTGGGGGGGRAAAAQRRRSKTTQPPGAGGPGDRSSIGVLDIFGFESFERNSFEQLCINYCNEKLQQHFNEHIFKLEQEEYAREGVDVSQISFADNAPALEALEGRKSGVLAVLDEEVRLPRGSDKDFLSKLLASPPAVLRAADVKTQRSDKNARFCFVVTHYAGEVAYDSRGFLDKNRDSLLTDLAGLCAGSSFPFLAALFGKGSGAAGSGGSSNKKTIGTQFREQLADLMTSLNATDPHYIRCIKPNGGKRAGVFEARMVLDQLRCAGLLEVCRIRQMGYPVRKSFAEFQYRYRPLAPTSARAKSGHAALAAELEARGFLAPGQWQLGRSKVFLRTEQFTEMELAREEAVAAHAAVLQRIARGYVARGRVRAAKRVRAAVAAAAKARDAAQLEAALLATGALPFKGRHLPDVRSARALLATLRDQERVRGLLQAALARADRSELEAALRAAQELGMGGDADAARATKALAQLDKQREAAGALRAAVASREPAALAAALKSAAALGMTGADAYKDAAALSEQLAAERAAVKELEKLVAKKRASGIRALLPRVAELGLADTALAQQAQALAKSEAKPSAAAQHAMQMLQTQLADAIDARDAPALAQLTRRALEMGLRNAAVDEALRLRAELDGAADVVGRLTAAMRALELRLRSHDGVSARDVAPLSEALAAAQAAGLGAAEEEVTAASLLEERAHRQMRAQQQVRDALADGSEAALRRAVPVVQETGLETADAQQLLAEVRDRDASKGRGQTRGAAAAARRETRRALRQATAEERLKDDLLRVVQAGSGGVGGGGDAAHAELLREAADNARYDWRKFYRLRPDEDFTEHAPEETKAAYAQYKLRWQTKPLPKSLLDMDAALSRTAVQNHKAVLQYCGELSNNFPSAMAGYILVRGLETPELCDEIYAQLMKHLTHNLRPLSEERAWALLCMVTRAFPPSPDLLPFALNFMLNLRAARGLTGNYARLCAVQLLGTADMGPSEFLPDMDAVEAYASRPGVLAHVTRGDGGAAMRIPVPPHHDVAYLLDMCNQNAGVPEDAQQLFGVFVMDRPPRADMTLPDRLTRFYKKYNRAKLQHVPHFAAAWSDNEEALFATLEKKYGPEPSPDEDVDAAHGGVANGGGGGGGGQDGPRSLLRLPVTAARSAAKMLGLAADPGAAIPAPESPWALPWWAFPGDVLVRMAKQDREPAFSHKRAVIYREEPMTDALFAQVRGEVRSGDLALGDDGLLAKLVALDIALQRAERRRSGSRGGAAAKEAAAKEAAREAGTSFQDQVAQLVPAAALRRHGAGEWEELVLAAQGVLEVPRSPGKIRAAYWDLCRKLPTFGVQFCTCQLHGTGDTVHLGVGRDGILMLNANRSVVVRTMRFASIQKFGASGSYFWLLLVEGKPPASESLYLRTVTPWSLYSQTFQFTHLAAEQQAAGK